MSAGSCAPASRRCSCARGSPCMPASTPPTRPVRADAIPDTQVPARPHLDRSDHHLLCGAAYTLVLGGLAEQATEGARDRDRDGLAERDALDVVADPECQPNAHPVGEPEPDTIVAAANAVQQGNPPHGSPTITRSGSCTERGVSRSPSATATTWSSPVCRAAA